MLIDIDDASAPVKSMHRSEKEEEEKVLSSAQRDK